MIRKCDITNTVHANGAGPSFLLILLFADGCIVGLPAVTFADGAPSECTSCAQHETDDNSHNITCSI